MSSEIASFWCPVDAGALVQAPPTFTRDEIVDLVRFKSLEQGCDPEDVFRDFAAGDLRHFPASDTE